MQLRRVVITGLGAISPLGATAESSWKSLLAGKNAARKIDAFNVEDLACKIASSIDDATFGFQPEDFMPAKEVSRFERFIHLGVAAAAEAFESAKLDGLSEEERLRAGVLMGSGIGGFERIATTHTLLEKQGPRRISPFFCSGGPRKYAPRLCQYFEGISRPESCSCDRLCYWSARHR